MKNRIGMPTLEKFGGMVVGLFVLAAAHGIAQAEPSSELSELFQSQIRNFQALTCSDQVEARNDGDLPLKRFFLNVSPSVTLGIRGFADVTITPEIEFGWVRTTEENEK